MRSVLLARLDPSTLQDYRIRCEQRKRRRAVARGERGVVALDRGRDLRRVARRRGGRAADLSASFRRDREEQHGGRCARQDRDPPTQG